MIDKAAQGWLNLIEGISLNVFEGFESEEDMVNYFLTQAYAENVSVIAGESIGSVFFFLIIKDILNCHWMIKYDCHHQLEISLWSIYSRTTNLSVFGVKC